MKKFIGLLMIPAMLLVGGCDFKFGDDNNEDEEEVEVETIEIDAGFEAYLQAANATKNKTEYNISSLYLDDDGLREVKITGNSDSYYEVTLDSDGDEAFYYEVEKNESTGLYVSNYDETYTEEEFEDSYSLNGVIEFLSFSNKLMYETALEENCFDFDDSERLISKGTPVHSFTKIGNTYTWRITNDYGFGYTDKEYSSVAQMTITFDSIIKEINFSRTVTEIGTTNSVQEVVKNYAIRYSFNENLAK